MQIHFPPKQGQLLRKLISSKHAEREKRRKRTDAAAKSNNISIVYFISYLWMCSGRINNRKHPRERNVCTTCRPSLAARFVSMDMCMRCPRQITSSVLFFCSPAPIWFSSFPLIVRFNGKITLRLRKSWEAITSCQILRTVAWQSPWRPLKCLMFCFHNKVSCPFLPGKTTNEAQNQLEVPSEGSVCTCSVAQFFLLVQMLHSRTCPDLAHVCFSSLFTATLPGQLTFDFPYWESKHTPDTHTHTYKMRPKRSGRKILQGFSKDFYSKSSFFSPCFLNKACQKNLRWLFYLTVLYFFANWVWDTLFGSPLFPIKDEVLLAYVHVRERKHASMCQRSIFTLTIHAAFLSSSICCSEHQGYIPMCE